MYSHVVSIYLPLSTPMQIKAIWVEVEGRGDASPTKVISYELR